MTTCFWFIPGSPATARRCTKAGCPARGGSIEAAGPVVFNGTVLVNSGYLFGGRMAGNVLLAFAVPQPKKK